MIRPAQYTDIFQIGQLSQQFVNELKTVTPVPLEIEDVEFTIKGLLQSDDAQVYVAEVHRKVVGVIGGIKVPYFYNHSGLHVQEVLFYVQPDSRSLGVGKELLTCLEDWSREQGCMTLGMVAVAENSTMLKFYESVGYQLREYCVVKEL